MENLRNRIDVKLGHQNIKVDIKTSKPCFGDKIYLLNNGYDRLALGYLS